MFQPIRTASEAVPVVLGIPLTICRHPRARPLGRSARTGSLQPDPALNLIYLSEVTLPGNLACLTSLTRLGARLVTLRSAYLEMMPQATHAVGPRYNPTLSALASGNCFLSAQSSKALIGSFGSQHIRPGLIQLEVQNNLNLVDYLRTERFTVELSGTHRQRLNRPLPLRLQLEMDIKA